MIGQVPPANPTPPQRHAQPARAPIYRLSRDLDLLGAKPDKQIRQMTLIGHLGTRLNVTA